LKDAAALCGDHPDFGKDHRTYINIIGSIGVCYSAIKNFVEASNYLNEAYDRAAILYGREVNDTRYYK